ncbi:MAG: sugar phosphate isomerase/epimerase family protein [Thermoguttaceae bacterium]
MPFTRRQFLQRGAVAAAAVTATTVHTKNTVHAQVLPQRGRAMRYEPPYKFAMCNEMYEGWTCERLFPYLARCGYSGVEIAPFTLANDVRLIGADERVRLRRLAEKHRLEIPTLHFLLAKTTGYYWTSPDPIVRQKTTEYFKELIRLCADLGGRQMVLGSPKQRSLLEGVTHEQAMEFATESLRQLVPMLEHCKITIAVEPLASTETDFLTTAGETVELIDRVASPEQVALHLDCKAIALGEKESIPEIIRRYHKHLAYFHANDKNLQGPGFGEIDFVPIFKALIDVGYRGWVSVEPFEAPLGLEKMTTGSIACLQTSLRKAME